MVNYIDEEKFFAWYLKNCKSPDSNHQRVLEGLYNRFCETGQQFYTISKENSQSGQTEKYVFRFEDSGCCGASTIFIYF